jgi:hypothetical protein
VLHNVLVLREPVGTELDIGLQGGHIKSICATHKFSIASLIDSSHQTWLTQPCRKVTRFLRLLVFQNCDLRGGNRMMFVLDDPAALTFPKPDGQSKVQERPLHLLGRLYALHMRKRERHIISCDNLQPFDTECDRFGLAE